MKELIIPIHPKAVIRPMQRNSCEKSPTQMLVSKEINVQREQMFSCLNNKFIFILYTLVFGPHVCLFESIRSSETGIMDSCELLWVLRIEPRASGGAISALNH